MTPDQITQANAELRDKPALDIVKWAIAQANGRAIVSTNYRPYEAVILHLVTQVQPDIRVLWAVISKLRKVSPPVLPVPTPPRFTPVPALAPLLTVVAPKVTSVVEL